MGFRLHHFYVLTEPGAPAADRLAQHGLIEGSRNRHPGQGTANRRFFFEDAYLEFIYFVDEHEARTGPGSVFRSLDRYRAANGSPFGLVLRGDTQENVDTFPGFAYQPEYFDEGVCFSVAENVDVLEEPNCFLLPLVPPSGGSEPRSPDPFRHVAAVTLSLPGTERSPALAFVAGVDRIQVQTGRPHLLEVEFGRTGGHLDMRPAMPLLLSW